MFLSLWIAYNEKKSFGSKHELIRVRNLMMVKIFYPYISYHLDTENLATIIPKSVLIARQYVPVLDLCKNNLCYTIRPRIPSSYNSACLLIIYSCNVAFFTEEIAINRCTNYRNKGTWSIVYMPWSDEPFGSKSRFMVIRDTRVSSRVSRLNLKRFHT